MEEALARGVQIFLALSAAYLIALWFALAVWAYRDIGARSQSVVTQVVGTLLVVLFSIPGALLYLLLRPKETLDEAYQRSLEEEYLLQDLEDVSVCHSCQRPVDEEFVLCPHCQTSLKEACPACARLISLKWSVCPYCGANQAESAAVIRQQLPAPEDRFVERGAGAFRPLQSSPTIQEAPSLPFAERDLFIGPIIQPQGIESGPEVFSDPDDEESTSAEPIRLFDRKRTRMLKAAGEMTNANGTESTDPGAGDDASQPSASASIAARNGLTSAADAQSDDPPVEVEPQSPQTKTSEQA